MRAFVLAKLRNGFTYAALVSTVDRAAIESSVGDCCSAVLHDIALAYILRAAQYHFVDASFELVTRILLQQPAQHSLRVDLSTWREESL